MAMAYQYCSTYICASEDLPLDQSENKCGKNKLSVVGSNAKVSTGEQPKRSRFLFLVGLKSY